MLIFALIFQKKWPWGTKEPKAFHEEFCKSVTVKNGHHCRPHSARRGPVSETGSGVVVYPEGDQWAAECEVWLRPDAHECRGRDSAGTEQKRDTTELQ